MSARADAASTATDGGHRPRSTWTPWNRLAVSLLVPALVVFIDRRGWLPGVERAAFDRVATDGPNAHPGLFSIGLLPFFVSSLVVEVLASLVPRWRALRQGNPRGREMLRAKARQLSVLVALALALSLRRSLVPSGAIVPGVFASVALITSAAAGSVVLVFAAEWLGRRGLVNGFACIALGRLAAAMPGKLALFEAARGVPMTAWIAGAAAIVLGAAIGLERVGRISAHPPTYRKAPDVPTLALSIPFPAAGLVGAATALLALASFRSASARASSITFASTAPALFFAGCVTLVLTFVSNRPAALERLWNDLGVVDPSTRPAARRQVVLTAVLAVALTCAVFALARASGLPEVVLVAVAGGAMAADAMSELRARSRSDLITIFEEHRPYALDPAREALAAEGIETFVRARRLGLLASVVAPWAPFELMVERADAARARASLAPILAGELQRGLAPVAPSRLEPPRLRESMAALASVAVAFAVSALVRIPPFAPPSIEISPDQPGSASSHSPQVTFGISAIDDEVAPFASLEIDERLGLVTLPGGVVLRHESVPLGAGTSKDEAYAAILSHTEEAAESRHRFESWLQSLELPRLGEAEFIVAPLLERSMASDDYAQVGWRSYVSRAPSVTGRDLVSAEDRFDPIENKAFVELGMSEGGARRFTDLTARWTGRRIAIVVDGVVTSAPVVMERIGGGTARIIVTGTSGAASMSEAKRLASELRGER